MTDLNDAFEKLEERLRKVAEILKETQSERRGGQQELDRLTADLKERGKRIDALEREIQAARREREEVRERVEKLLRHLDVLTKSGSAE